MACVFHLVAVLLALALPAAAGAVTVTHFPSTDQVVTTGWTNASNAFADDTSYATADPGKNQTVDSDFGGFGFDAAVPVGATINLVTVEVTWKVSTTASIATLGAQAYVSGAAQGSELVNTAEPTADTTETQSYVLTRDQLLDGAFVVRVRASRAGNTAYTASLDYVKVTVDYTAGSPSTALVTGTNPPGATVCPGTAGTYADQFGFTVAVTNDTIGDLTVAGLGATTPLSLVEIRQDTGASFVPAKTGTPAGDTFTFSGANLPANVGTTYYRLYFDVKSHAALAAGDYTVTPIVQTYTSGNPQAAATDTANAFTIDNSAAGNVASLTATPAVSAVDLSWPAVGGAAEYVVWAREASAPTETPVDGTTYTQGTPQQAPTSWIAYVGAGTSTTVGGLDASSTYYFKIYARDACRNWSATAATANATTLSPSVTTVGDGSNPSSASLAPGGAATMLDAFTLGATGNADTVTSLTVTLAPSGAWNNIASVAVTNDAGTTTHGSATPAADAVNVSLGSGISAPLGSTTQYKVRITPKTHAAMPSPSTGQSYATTGTVTAIVSTNSNKTYDDTASATVTIDNLSPAAPTGAIATAGEASNTVSWTNPGGDFAQAVVLRKAGSAPTEVPVEGASYSAGETLGTSTIAYAGTGATFVDQPLANGTTYHYAVYSKDGSGNYSASATTASATPESWVVTVGDGTNPSSASVCPGGAATMLDAFTLGATLKPDTITKVNVKLAPAAAYRNIGTLEVTNDAGTTVYGSATPAGVDVLVSLGAGISAPLGSTTQYKVRITPKTHAAMPSPSTGQSYATMGVVTAISGGNPTPTYADAASATITVDNGSPANPAWGTITASGSIVLSWTGPSDADLSQVIVLRDTVPIPEVLTEVPAEGTTYTANSTPWGAQGPRVVYAAAATPGAAGSHTDSPANGTYYYKAFAKDACGNYSVGSLVGPIVLGGGGVTEGDISAGLEGAAVSIINPAKRSAVAGTFKVQLRVFYPGGRTISGGDLALSTNGGSTYSITGFARNSNYGTAADSGVFEVNVTGLAVGTYTLRARAVNGGGTVASAAVPIRVNAAGGGGGTLLARDNSSQLCNDCHALRSHSAEPTPIGIANKYGSWSTTCRDCHAPHGTTNAYLIANKVTPPAVTGYQGPKDVYFAKKTGYSSAGGAGNKAEATYANADNTGICQACHTRTVGLGGVARYQNNAGAGDGHYANEACTTCHSHAQGFRPDGNQCKDCHLTTTADVDSYVWGEGFRARINQAEWDTYGHGSEANYPSGNGAAKFSREGNALGDLGCMYCHTSSSSHNDPQNYFRLANLSSYGPNGTCLVCHAKKLNGNPPPGYDPDGAGGDYSPIVSSKRIDLDHAAGAGHQAPDDTGGNFCWDCHDPHGDKSQSNGVLYFMLQNKLVEKNVAATSQTPPYGSMWGTPQAAGFAGAYEFNPATCGVSNVFEYQDYFNGPGICTRCHDQENIAAGTGVKYYYKSGSYNCTTVPHDGGGSLRSRCSDCHAHPIGCGGCHNAPPTSGVHDRHNQRLADDQVVNYLAPTSEATPILYGFRCVKCHNGAHANQAADPILGKSAANPYQVDLNFESANDPKNPKPPAAYTRAGPWTSYQGGNGDWWGYTAGGYCASVYCHSNGAPADYAQTYAASITWQPQTGWDCTKCHGSAANTSTMSVAHGLHAGSTNYGYGCEKCHSATVTNATTLSTAAGGGKMLHVNGLKDVVFDPTFSQTGGSYDGTGMACSNIYCHSDGTDRDGSNGYVSGPSVAWTTTGAVTCRYCHGGDATSTPTIGTTSGSPKHALHVNNEGVLGTNYMCKDCHATVASATSNTQLASRTNHVSGTPDLSFAARGPVPAGGTYTLATGTCSSVYCHSSGQASPSYVTGLTWTSPAIGCNGCHGTTRTNGDPDYGTGNSHAKHVGTPGAATTCYRCHSATVTTQGTAIATGSVEHTDGTRDVVFGSYAAPGTYTPASKTCSTYCHSNAGPWNGSAYSTPTYASPTWGSPALACTGCHGGAGAATTMSGPHAKHVNPNASSAYAYGCQKCHNQTTQDGTTILAGSTKHVDGTRTDVFFDATNPSGAYTAGTHTCSSTYCHGNFVGGNNATPTWSSTVACNSCHGIPPSNHQPGDTDCNGCHPGYTQTSVVYATHANGTIDGGGGCMGCHGSVKDDPGSPGSARRAVVPDFALNSHHAGNGTANMGGTLTDNDCAVCHAEANVPASQGGSVSPGALHKNGMIDLRNADDNTAYFQYDKRRICIAAGGAAADCDTAATPANPTPWGATNANWHSGTAVWREETSGRTDDAVGAATVACNPTGAGCSKGLDRFCLSCHDSNGASQAHLAGESGATAGNPFKDLKITNESDQFQRPSRTGAPDPAGSVVDINSKISGSPPPNGAFSRHAVRGQSLSRYTVYAAPNRTIFTSGNTGVNRFVQRGTDASGRPNWNDTSVMGCPDCHAVDGANGTNGNGHGANSEYLLKDANGAATEGRYDSKAGLYTYVCYRCHVSANYDSGGNGEHTGNGSDWVANELNTGADRVSNRGNWAGFTCTNCHGAMLNDTTVDFGGIHGTSGTFTNKAGGTRDAYRFTNGGSMRFYDPGVWDQLAQNCYTITSADSYGGCTQHSKAGSKDKPFTRPLNY